MRDCDQAHAKKQSQRIQELENQLLDQQEVNSSLQRELQGITEENEDLRATLGLAASEPTYPDSSGTSGLRSALADLRERYDSLSKAKEDAATAYKKDYRQWREFKRHLYKDTLHNKKIKNHGTDVHAAKRRSRALGGTSRAEKMSNNGSGTSF